MAWTNISKLYSKKCKSDTVSYLKARMEYMTNDEKTNNQKYVNCYKCNFDTAHILFEEAKAKYLIKTGRKQEEDVVAYRVLQSFKGYETTPEIANKIGYELAMKLTKGNHAFVVSTHIDTNNIHNHITWASTSLDCKSKFKDNYFSWKDLAKASDELCMKYGLSIILPTKQQLSKDYGSWLNDKGIQKPKSFTDKVKLSIDEVLNKKPKSFEDFLKELELLGYEIKKSKNGNNVGIKGNGQKNFIYLNSLGGNYSQSKIIDLILNLVSSEKPKDEKIKLVIDLEKAFNEKGVAYSMWARQYNMEQLLKTINFMYDNKLKSYADVKAKYDELTPRYDVVSNKIKSINEQMEKISKMQNAIINYSKTKEIYNKYKMSGYSKKFKKDNLEQITIFENAKKEFKELGNGGKLPTMQELKQEYAKLKSDKQNAYNEYKEINTDMQDLINTKGNLETLLQIDVQEKNQEKQKGEKQKEKDKTQARE